MSKKICFLIPSLGSGGAERVVCNLGNAFLEKSYNVTIVLLNACEKPAYPVASGVRLITLISQRTHDFFGRIFYGIATGFKLYSFLRRERPCIVFAFQTSANLWGGLICRVLRIPYTVSERTSPDRTINKKSYLFQKIAADIYMHAKATIAPSTGILSSLKKNKHFKNIDNFSLIRNHVGIQTTDYPEQVHSRRFILGAGRLEYVKGFDLLIDAFSSTGLRDIDLLIVGRGRQRDALTAKIASMGLQKNAILVGEVDNIYDFYTQCEAFILPSRNEGYPNALIEAMSAGAPCIAFDCNFGPSEIINDGQNGLLIQANDTKMLSDAIVKLMACQHLRDKLSNEGREILKTNSFEKIVSEWEALIPGYA